MSFIEDFPNTTIYDKDLGWLIRQYKELNDNYEVLKDIYNIVKEQIHDITLTQLKEWLDDGTLSNIVKNNLNLVTVYTDTETLISSSNTFKGMLVRTINNHGKDGYGSIYMLSDKQDTTTYNFKLNNNLYANMIIFNTFYLEQVDSTDLDLLLPLILKSNMSIYLRNAELSITYKENRYSNLSNVLIDFSNSKINAKTPYNMTHASIIEFYDCYNITLKGGVFNGNSEMNLAVDEDTEWCHAISIKSTDKYCITDMIIHDFSGDGIEVGNVKELPYREMSGTLKNLEIYNTHRNGISILDGDMVIIKNCYIHDITQLKSNPVQQPLAGIDCEPWYDIQHFNNIKIDNVRVETGGGVLLFTINSTTPTLYNVENSWLSHLTFTKMYEVTNSDTLYTVDNTFINIGVSVNVNCTCNLNYTKNGNNDYRALEINLDKDSNNKDFFINADINLVDSLEFPKDIQQVYCSNNNNFFTSNKSKMNVSINSGMCDCTNFKGKCSILNEITEYFNYSPLLSSFNSNIKYLNITNTGTFVLGSSYNIYQPIFILVHKTITYSCENSDYIEYKGDVSGSANEGDVLQIIPYTPKTGKKIYFIRKI